MTVEARVNSMSVDQLKQELSLLSLAGFGGAMLEFKTGTTGWLGQVTLRMFKPIADDPKVKR